MLVDGEQVAGGDLATPREKESDTELNRTRVAGGDCSALGDLIPCLLQRTRVRKRRACSQLRREKARVSERHRGHAASTGNDGGCVAGVPIFVGKEEDCQEDSRRLGSSSPP
ncbi:hypothetical protein F442_04827 [Phytophthora nicotianae P10297]|uniref:Uncharacterized protein n=2 Tax=Phytophthora nicotianae TaxID=4792 RepID=W2ZRP4_PHYNI|nr:hypothetical protein L917_04475 [Phytophthora nicotianae]ETP49680.1 hypothetical protein F442_04827 [Phytophthora nicotianae P10297]